MRAHRPPDGSSRTRPNRRHPARVYWVRRLLALTVVAALVVGLVGVGRLLLGQSGDSGTQRATSASAESDATPDAEPDDAGSPGADTSAEPGEDPTAGAGTEGPGGTEEDQDGAGAKKREPLARPDGPCDDEDVVVTPSIRRGQAVGGSPITIRLDLTSVESDACRWRVEPDSVTMRITSGSDEIWTSRECPGVLPERNVVVRREHRTRLRVSWSARRSDADCSRLTDWALPGFYHVEAAALAGEPREDQFEVVSPAPDVVERTVEPKPTKQDKQDRQQKKRRQEKQDGQQSGG